MSSAEEISVDGDELPSLQEVVARLQEVEAELENERERRQAAEERIDELEAELDSRAPIRWEEGESPGDMVVENPAGFTWPLGGSILGRADKDVVDDIDDRLQRLEHGDVDVEEVVGITGDNEASLPIEDVIARCRSDVAEDPSANRKRAAVVFRAFGGRAESTQGGKMWLTSAQVEGILTDPERGAMDSVNRRTRKTVMQMVAKLTTRRDDPDTGRARDEENNLITLTKKENGTLALLADTSEWNKYMREVEERIQ
jgi:hypothetical protein